MDEKRWNAFARPAHASRSTSSVPVTFTLESRVRRGEVHRRAVVHNRVQSLRKLGMGRLAEPETRIAEIP